jgi:hypothetical protein
MGGACHLRPQQEGVVFAISGRHGHSTRPASFATPGYGESPGRSSVFHPNYGFIPVAAAPVWTGTWRWWRGEWSQLPKAEVVLAVGLVLYGGASS